METADIEQLLKDRLQDVEKDENVTYRDYFIKSYKQKLSDEATFKDVKKAADLYQKIGEQMRLLMTHYEKSLVQVKNRLRKELKESKKFNWLQHIHNNTIENFDEDRLEQVVQYYLDEKNISADTDMNIHRKLVEKCQRKFNEFRVSAYENLEKMLSQVFLKFKRVFPLQESTNLNAPSVSLAPYSENCFFLLNNGGKTISIREKVNGQLENNLIKDLQTQINAFVVVEPTKILLREQESGEVSSWNTVDNQVDQLQLDGANLITQIKVFSNQLLAFSQTESSKISFMNFDKNGEQDYYSYSLAADEYEEQKESNVSVLDFIEVNYKNKQHVAVAYDDGFVRLFELKGQEQKHPEVRKFRRVTIGKVTNIIQMNEFQIAGAGDDSDSTIDVWNLNQLSTEPSQFYKGHLKNVIKLFMLTPHLLVSASNDNSVRIWNSRSGTKLREFRFQYQITDVLSVKDSIIVSTTQGTLFKIF